jgi:hypothetical protein
MNGKCSLTADRHHLEMINNMKRVFWFHYNKPYSKQYGVDKWTVHTDGKCYIVSYIKCYTNTFSRTRKSQPKVVMHGKSSNITFENDCCIIR